MFYSFLLFVVYFIVFVQGCVYPVFHLTERQIPLWDNKVEVENKNVNRCIPSDVYAFAEFRLGSVLLTIHNAG